MLRIALDHVGSVAELARRIGVAPRTIRSWQDGRASPSAASLARLRALVSDDPPEDGPRCAELISGALSQRGAVLPEPASEDPWRGPLSARSIADAEQRGIPELKQWVEDTPDAPAWLRRAARRARGLLSMAEWTATVGDDRDLSLGLERAHDMLERIEQPLYARRLWAEVVAVLWAVGARPTQRMLDARVSKRARGRRGKR